MYVCIYIHIHLQGTDNTHKLVFEMSGNLLELCNTCIYLQTCVVYPYTRDACNHVHMHVYMYISLSCVGEYVKYERTSVKLSECVHVRTQISVCVHVCMLECMHMCVCTYTCTYMHMNIRVCVYTCMYVYMYVCMHVYMYVICIYIYTNMYV